MWWGYSHLIAGAWHATVQGRNEVRQRLGQEASLVPPCSNLRSLGSKCTALKKVLVTMDFFALPQSFGMRGVMPPLFTPLRSYKCQLILLGCEKNETAAVANEDIVSGFATKLDDCMFKVSSWHWKCLREYYSSIMLCSRCQNCSFCDSLCSNFFSLYFMFSFFVVPKDVSKTASVDKR